MPCRRKKYSISIRGLIAPVLLAGVVFWLLRSAGLVYSERDFHVHTFVDVGRESPTLAAWNRPAPFWPRYTRKLLGRPWRRQPLCGPTPGARAELCEFAHPEMVIKIGKKVAYNFSPEQADCLEAIESQRKGK